MHWWNDLTYSHHLPALSKILLGRRVEICHATLHRNEDELALHLSLARFCINTCAESTAVWCFLWQRLQILIAFCAHDCASCCRPMAVIHCWRKSTEKHSLELIVSVSHIDHLAIFAYICCFRCIEALRIISFVKLFGKLEDIKIWKKIRLF